MGFRELKMGVKMGIGFGMMIGMVLIILGMTLTTYRTIGKDASRIKDEALPYALLADQMVLNITQVQEEFTDAAATGHDDGLKGAKEAADSFAKALATFKETAKRNNDDASLQKIADLEKSFEAYYGTGKQMAEAYVGGNKPEGDRLMEDFDKTTTLMTDKAGAFQKGHVKVANELSREMYLAMGSSRNIVILVGLVALLLGVGIAISATRSVTGPIHETIKIIQKLANGEFVQKTDANMNNEIGELGRAINQMVDNMRTLISGIIGNSRSLNAAADEMRQTAEQMATGAEQVATQAGLVATAGEEMAATSADIARNCSLAAGSSREAIEAATSGSQVVDRTVDNMGRIAQRVQETAATVAELGSRSDQIGTIIGTIEDIADQTNLLALNAAIEAARAGDQGRGFAVVADEVRALAERTARATREIGAMIKSIQTETGGAVSSMEEGVSEVERGTGEAARSGAALKEILDQVRTVTSQVDQIATAAEEQTATTGEISRNMMQINDVVQETAKGAGEAASAAHEVSRLASELQQMVSRFKIAG
ncbi:methyl-accepting chemotaxis protein [Geomesophilobacter sediminis]|uniref:Methyl-accepting chemotaxis protein n=1 Tax=Geomesophilobacter sediminis TaxID=2798584 RepID=A0A8J7JAL3_9BACT|nr:methyl-accepting chemotaxis protein [Geomesophilobacter sediminis]MBJ6723428.1 methyl-accepting chemotaxis protein [Geomesophilobacter sediminis]